MHLHWEGSAMNKAKAAAIGGVLSQNLKQLEVNKEEIGRSEKFIWKEGVAIKLVLPEEVVEVKSDRTVVYHMQAVTTNKIEILSKDYMEECLGSLSKQQLLLANDKNTVWWNWGLPLKKRVTFYHYFMQGKGNTVSHIQGQVNCMHSHWKSAIRNKSRVVSDICYVYPRGEPRNSVSWKKINWTGGNMALSCSFMPLSRTSKVSQIEFPGISIWDTQWYFLSNSQMYLARVVVLCLSRMLK